MTNTNAYLVESHGGTHRKSQLGSTLLLRNSYSEVFFLDKAWQYTTFEESFLCRCLIHHFKRRVEEFLIK